MIEPSVHARTDELSDAQIAGGTATLVQPIFNYTETTPSRTWMRAVPLAFQLSPKATGPRCGSLHVAVWRCVGN